MEFLNLTVSFNFIQHVSGPIHTKGNTLDLVFTIRLKVSSVCSKDFLLSDHKGVMFSLAFDNDFVSAKCVKSLQIISSLAVESFKASFDDSVLMSYVDDVDFLVHDFQTHLIS